MKLVITNAHAYNSKEYRGMDLDSFLYILEKFAYTKEPIDVCMGFTIPITEDSRNSIIQTIKEFKKLLNGEIIEHWLYVSNLRGVPFTLFNVGEEAKNNYAEILPYGVENVKEFTKKNKNGVGWFSVTKGYGRWQCEFKQGNSTTLLANAVLAKHGKVWGEF